MSIKSLVKSFLSDNNEANYKLVEVGIEKKWLSNHDQAHIECSKLSSIQMGDTWVNGINGVSIPEFGREGLMPHYSAYFDECRVAIHQWCKKKTPCSTARLVYYCYWMITNGVNPVTTILAHIKSMN